MDVKIIPGKLRGRITAMPSKSHAHRVLIAQKLAQLQGKGCKDPLFIPEFSRDITATKNCLAQLDSCAGADYYARTGDDLDSEEHAGVRTAVSQTAIGAGLRETATAQNAGNPVSRRNTTDSATAAEPGTCSGTGIRKAAADSAVTTGRDIPLLDCGESGSTLRFMLPVAMAVTDKAIFAGSGKLPQRPISPLKEEMENHGCVFTMGAGLTPDSSKGGTATDDRTAKDKDNATDCITGGGTTEICTITGRLQPGEYTLPGNISSQFITGLLFALPILDGDSRLRLTTGLESAGYVALSLDVLRDFGIDIRIDSDENGFIVYDIKGGQKYTEPEGLSIEGDWSNAAFWLACGALGGDIICDGLRADSSQRDREILTVLQNLGADVTTETGEDGLTTVICRAPGSDDISGADEAADETLLQHSSKDHTDGIIPRCGSGVSATGSTACCTASAGNGRHSDRNPSGDSSADNMWDARQSRHATDVSAGEGTSEVPSVPDAAPEDRSSGVPASGSTARCTAPDGNGRHSDRNPSGDISTDNMWDARQSRHVSDVSAGEGASEVPSVPDAAPEDRSSGVPASGSMARCDTAVLPDDGRMQAAAGASGEGSITRDSASDSTDAASDDPGTCRSSNNSCDIMRATPERDCSSAHAPAGTGSGLTAIHLDVTQIPDLVPVLAAVMSAAEGDSVITGAARLRIKESDRLETVRDFLSRLGAGVECQDDGLSITGSNGLAGGEVSSHNDHRIAMAAAVASCVCRGPVIIRGADAVSKSYPDFFSDFAGLGGRVSKI